MDTQIDYIFSLIRKAEKTESADEALKFSQAALNAANACGTIKANELAID